jgi:hypothetical protein
MTDDEIKRLRALYDADNEAWSGDAEYGYECICGRALYLAQGLEPRGLCDDCKDRLMTAVPALLDETERLRAALIWARTRLLDNGRGETSLLGIANVLAGIEDALSAETSTESAR